MNRDQYREAFDQISFSPDFQTQTLELLHKHTQKGSTKRKHIYKPAAVAVAAALLILSASAIGIASFLLSPAQVAEVFDEPLLAEAFRSDGAVIINETLQDEELVFTLAGLVSGEGLTSQDVDASHTYAVVAVRRVDGTPLMLREYVIWGEEAPEGYAYLGGEITVTPLVSGYSPEEVNAGTLESTVTWFEQDGVLYYLLDTHNIEIFADHTVYLAVYDSNMLFQPEFLFTMNEDGSFSYSQQRNYLFYDSVIFTLPLDESKADPEAVQAFFDRLDFENGEITQGGLERNTIHYSYQNWHSYLLTTEEFEAYCTDRLARLAVLVEQGKLSQEEYDEYERILALNVAAVRDEYMLVSAQSNGEGFVSPGWLNNGLDSDENGFFQGYPTEDGFYQGEPFWWWADFEALANPDAVIDRWWEEILESDTPS